MFTPTAVATARPTPRLAVVMSSGGLCGDISHFAAFTLQWAVPRPADPCNPPSYELSPADIWLILAIFLAAFLHGMVFSFRPCARSAQSSGTMATTTCRGCMDQPSRTASGFTLTCVLGCYRPWSLVATTQPRPPFRSPRGATCIGLSVQQRSPQRHSGFIAHTSLNPSQNTHAHEPHR